ncbi:hypothetical protein [Microvirga sp. 2TAF3]|uniref:cadherin repeat domain-containing protein n=1 Tax=Microvirga sp. 2TAF3 TaxID=3233014 RepID=UPI003F9AD0BB
MVHSVITAGEETKVNFTTPFDQGDAQVTALSDGGWLVTWVSDGQDGSGAGIYQAHFDKHGRKAFLTDKIVNIATSDQQYEPSVSALKDGGWIVTWTSAKTFGTDGDIYCQRYDRNGQKLYESDEAVNISRYGNQDSSSVTALSDGGWLVTWVSDGQDGDGKGVYQQRYNANGETTYTSEKLVNLYKIGDQNMPSVTALADGGWVVTWQSKDGEAGGIFQQHYSKDGQPSYILDDIVNITSFDHQCNQSVTALADGGWVVTWQSKAQDGSGYGIYQQRYDKDGHYIYLADQRVNVTTDGNQEDASVTALADGGWVVTWRSANYDIHQQRYDAAGQAAWTTDTQVNIVADYQQIRPTVAGLKDGGWVIAWASLNETLGDLNIIQRRYDLNTAPEKLSLSGQTIIESASAGTVIGILTTTDSTLDDTFTYTLLDNAGGRFAIQGSKLVVADGTKLDYEQSTSHQVTIRVSDKGELTLDKSFSIHVSDVIEANEVAENKNVFVGSAKNDTIIGTSGNNVLKGGSGRDTLTGGMGRDTFVFDVKASKTNLNKVTDFNVKDDTIWLENKYFKVGKGTEAKPVKLNGKLFWTGDKAHDKDDRIIFNKKSGVLYYDSDGTGKAKQIEIAILKKGLKMTYHDFFVI